MSAPLFRISELGRAKGVRALAYECREGPSAPKRDEQHRAFCIALVRRGTFTYHLNGASRVLGPGSLFLGNAGDEYSCSHDHEGGDDCTAFEYSPEALADVAREVGLRATGTTPSFFKLPALPSIPHAEPMVCRLTRNEGASAEETAYALAFCVLEELSLVAGANSAKRRRGGARRRDFDRANEAMIFIEKQATSGASISLQDLCARAGTSPFHFLRTFKSVVGVTPHQYLLRYRVRHAANLLRDSALPITAVAFESGFSDLSNFIRTFRSYFGRSPRAFRQTPPALIARSAK